MNGIIFDVRHLRRILVKLYIDIALIITSLALIVSVILQNKGIGLGGLTGADTGGVYTARRGIEKTLFWATIVLSVLFFVLTVTAVILEG
jgi:preprotein translocase subunit SecG